MKFRYGAAIEEKEYTTEKMKSQGSEFRVPRDQDETCTPEQNIQSIKFRLNWV